MKRIFIPALFAMFLAAPAEILGEGKTEQLKLELMELGLCQSLRPRRYRYRSSRNRRYTRKK